MAAPGDPDGGGRAPADDAQPRGDDEAREEGGEAAAEADANAGLSPPPPPEEASGVAELNQLIEAQVEALNALADKHRERAVQNGTDTVDASEAVTAWRDEQLAQALDRERERLFALEEQLVDEGVNPAADLPAVARAHAMSAASVGDGDDATLLVNPLRAAARSENGALPASARRPWWGSMAGRARGSWRSRRSARRAPARQTQTQAERRSRDSPSAASRWRSTCARRARHWDAAGWTGAGRPCRWRR